MTTDAVSSLQDQLSLHHQHRQLQQQPDDVTDVADSASSVDDAASEMSDEEAASVIEVELGTTDRHWSAVNTDELATASSLPSNSVPTAGDWSGPPSLPGNRPAAANDDAALRSRPEYIQTAPWRCLPIRHRASVASYSDPDISASAAAVSDFERQRLERARERRHLARSIDISLSSSSSSKSSSSVIHLQPATTTVSNNNNKRQQGGVVVSRNSYVPQKPPPPLPMPENELVKQLRPVQNNDTTTKPPPSSSSSSTPEQQRPVRELVAQLSGHMPTATVTTTTQLPQLQPPPPQQQQPRRQQRRHQLQQLHVRPLSSSSSDAEADYEIFINTPPAAAVRSDDESNDEKSVRCLSVSPQSRLSDRSNCQSGLV